MNYTRETELRKLKTAHSCFLFELLKDSPTESWLKLMDSIKMPDGQNRFTVKDRKMIEADVKNRKKSAIEIFVEDWSTMGKERPTLGYFMDLLVEVELLKAATYIAKLLNCKPPLKNQSPWEKFFGIKPKENKKNESSSSRSGNDQEIKVDLGGDNYSPQNQLPKSITPLLQNETPLSPTIEAPLLTKTPTRQHENNDCSIQVELKPDEKLKKSLPTLLVQPDLLSQHAKSEPSTSSDTNNIFDKLGKININPPVNEIHEMQSSELPVFLNVKKNNSPRKESSNSHPSTQTYSSSSDSGSEPFILARFNEKITLHKRHEDK